MKRILSLLLSLCLTASCLASLPQAFAAVIRHETPEADVLNTDEKRDLINAEALHPLRTGYGPLDDMVDAVFAEILTPEMTTYEKVRACYAYLTRDTVYSWDNTLNEQLLRELRITKLFGSSYDREVVSLAYAFLKEKVGVCSYYSSAFMVLTRAIGLESYTLSCCNGTPASGVGNHVASTIRLGGMFYVFDPVIDASDTAGNIEESGFFCTELVNTANRQYANVNETVAAFGGFQPGPNLNRLETEVFPEVTDASERHFTFGRYPQTQVTDPALVETLNGLLDPDSMQSYGYYCGENEPGTQHPADFMKYADIDWQGETYRAVCFTEYRPIYSFDRAIASLSYQDEAGYERNTVYWFRFEPIEWRLADGDSLLVSDVILDAQAFQNEFYEAETPRPIDDRDVYCFADAAHTLAANDWTVSSIRAWLNSDFYNTAFTGAEQALIRTSLLKTYGYSCWFNAPDCEDKVFLLSVNEATASPYYLTTEPENRPAGGTDYAKAQGLTVPKRRGGSYSTWLLRSAGRFSSDVSGIAQSNRTAIFLNPAATMLGVRPALRVDPEALVPPAVIAAPASLTATATETGEITLRTAVSSGANAYLFRVYEPGSDVPLKEIETASPSCVFQDLTPGTRYTFSVRAVGPTADGGVQTSAPVETEPVECQTFLPPPSDVVSSSSVTGKVTLSWTPVENAASYRVYRYIDSDTLELCCESQTPFCEVDCPAGYTHSFRISTVSQDGYEGKMTVKSIRCACITYPAMPTGLTAETPERGTVVLSWDAVDQAARYRVYRYANATDMILLGTVTEPTFTLTGLLTDFDYAFRVEAETEDGLSVSAKSRTLRVRFDSYPAAPRGVTAQLLKTGVIDVAWNAVEDAALYRVWQYVGGKELVEVGSTADTHLTLTGMLTNYNYVFCVTAETGDGADVSGRSASVEIYSESIPRVPRNLIAEPTGTGSFLLNWRASEGAAVYKVWQYVTASSVKLLGETAEPSFEVTGLTAGIDYTFCVTAESEDGADVSARSRSVTATCISYPDAPGNVTVTPSATGALTFTWTPSEDAALYRVWRYVGTNLREVGVTAEPRFTLTGLNPGYEVTFTVTAETADGADVSAKSAAVKGTALRYPDAPKDLTAEFAESGALTLRWAASALAERYEICRAQGDGGEFETVAEVQADGAAAPSYADGSLVIGQTYRYKVRAVAQISGYLCESPYSDEVSAAAAAFLSEPLDDARVVLSDSVLLYNGETRRPEVAVTNSIGQTLTENEDYTVSFSADSVFAGRYAVTVEGIGQYYGSVTKPYTVKETVVPDRISLSSDVLVYDGNVKSPTVTVRNAAGDVLKKGTDYYITIPAGRTEVGDYVYTVTGTGLYTGSAEKTLSIREGLKARNVTLSAEVYVYDGAVHTPSVTVKNDAGQKLVKNVDYTVILPKNRTKTGVYEYVITGKGNYTGEVTKRYAIKEGLAAANVQLSATVLFYTGGVLRPSVAVTNAAGETLTKNTDYTVTLPAGCIEPGAYAYTVTGIGAYTGSVKKTFYIKKKLRSENITLSGSVFAYTGKAVTPSVTVKNAEGEKLTKNTDYTIALPAGRTQPGTYEYVITGKGIYGGSVTKRFSIKNGLSAENVQLSASVLYYTGKAQSPGVTVTNAAGEKLTKNTDYTVTVPAGCTECGAYSYVITGIGGYTGTVTKTFYIKEKLRAERIALSGTSFAYTGSAITPSVTVKNAAGEKLIKNRDYTITLPAGRKEIGVYEYTITGRGDYTGTVTKRFSIKRGIAEGTVTLSGADFAYTGKAITPGVTVKNAAGETLTKNVDYTITLPAGRTERGTYTYVITGKGAYAGTATASFTIR